MEQPAATQLLTLTAGCRCMNTYSPAAVNAPARPKSNASKCCQCMHVVGVSYRNISRALRRDRSLIIRWSKQSDKYTKRPPNNRINKGAGRPTEYPYWQYLRGGNSWAWVKECYWSRHPEYKAYLNKRKYNTNIGYRVKTRARKRVRAFLKIKGINKTRSSSKYIGCTGRFLKQHLEQQFKPEMNWHNYGKVWNIDHLVPLSQARTEMQTLKLSHWTNLRPELVTANIRKGGKTMKQCVLL